jgi:hypothetical protein
MPETSHPHPSLLLAKVAGPDARHSFKLERVTTMRFTRNIGMLLLAIFLIAWGVAQLVPLGSLGLILAILAIAAGIFILLGR